MHRVEWQKWDLFLIAQTGCAWKCLHMGVSPDLPVSVLWMEKQTRRYSDLHGIATWNEMETILNYELLIL